MKNTAPRIPITLPTNSIVDSIPSAAGAANIATSAPTTIMGIPTPTVMAFEVTPCVQHKIYMNFDHCLGVLGKAANRTRRIMFNYLSVV